MLGGCFILALRAMSAINCILVKIAASQKRSSNSNVNKLKIYSPIQQYRAFKVGWYCPFCPLFYPLFLRSAPRKSYSWLLRIFLIHFMKKLMIIMSKNCERNHLLAVSIEIQLEIPCKMWLWVFLATASSNGSISPNS